MNLLLLAAAAASILSVPALAAPVGACAPAARQAAVAHIENGPAIGQVTSPGSAFTLDPHRLRFEVDVFGPQTYVYRVDVTVDGRCNATDFDTQLLNNPWGGAR
jgi:hypothetical protein